MGINAAPQTTILIDNKPYNFKNGTWDKQLKNLYIFDSNFVEKNVFSGSSIDSDHKKNLCYFVLGEQGVGLAETIDDLTRKISEQNINIRSKERLIKQHIKSSMSIDNFIKLSCAQNIENKITEKEKEINALKQESEIKNKPLFKVLNIPELATEKIAQILSKNLTNISKDAEEKVKAHIKRCMDTKGEAWTKQGLSYIKDAVCPFCEQSIEDVSLITAYRSYFNEEYKNFKKEIDSFSANLKNDFSNHNLIEIIQVIESNKGLFEFWKTFIEIKSNEISLKNDIQKTWADISVLLEEKLKHKAEAPLEIIGLGDINLQLEEYKNILDDVANYNKNIGGINEKINYYKDSLGIKDLAQLDNGLNFLKDNKKRFEPAIDELCKEYGALTKEKITLENQKRRTRTELDGYTENIFQKYQEKTNCYLNNFGANFTISNYKSAYPGGKLVSNYCLCINDISIKLTSSAENMPSFKNTLSAGDKSTLAFAFFLAKIDQTNDLSETIIVFDDPISSLDWHRKHCTQQQIIAVSQQIKQAIVLSHDQFFLFDIWKGTKQRQETPQTLQIKRINGNNSTISLWDIEAETQSAYFKNYFLLAEYLEKGANGDLRSIARCIRPLLEGNLRLRFPKKFKANEWLGNFLGTIRKACNNDPLICTESVCKELCEINDYSKKYHHDQNPLADSEGINETELSTYVERTLKLIPGIFSDKCTHLKNLSQT